MPKAGANGEMAGVSAYVTVVLSVVVGVGSVGSLLERGAQS